MAGAVTPPLHRRQLPALLAGCARGPRRVALLPLVPDPGGTAFRPRAHAPRLRPGRPLR